MEHTIKRLIDVIEANFKIPYLLTEERTQINLKQFSSSVFMEKKCEHAFPRDSPPAIDVYLQEMDFSEHLIQASEALQEMSHGVWEGCLRSDVYTPDVSNLIDRILFPITEFCSQMS
ncbi:hypothetical protein LXL04_030055 [Taraxacum kok-saghyz]